MEQRQQMASLDEKEMFALASGGSGLRNVHRRLSAKTPFAFLWHLYLSMFFVYLSSILQTWMASHAQNSMLRSPWEGSASVPVTCDTMYWLFWHCCHSAM
jgi:hypothetical protein